MIPALITESAHLLKQCGASTAMAFQRVEGAETIVWQKTAGIFLQSTRLRWLMN